MRRIVFALGVVSLAIFLWRRFRKTLGTVPIQGDIRLKDGVVLPCEIAPAPCHLLVAHGLGSDDPSKKTHASDTATTIVKQALASLAGTRTAVFYTARGHGASSGWEHLGVDQFQWAKLAEDMRTVADAVHGSDEPVVAIGNSMGAATALYFAMGHPTRCKALILIRPPTAWETRTERSHVLVEKAGKLQDAQPGSHGHLVVHGASKCNLPPKNDRAYRAVRCPVLVLGHGRDAAHPLSTATALADLLPQATLITATDVEDAMAEWPSVVADFLRRKSSAVSGI